MGSRTGFTDGRATVREVRPKGLIRDYTETILVCIVLVVFVRTFVFQQSEIPSGSMEDTILVGDYVLVNRFLYAPTSFDWERRMLPIRDIRRGDVVVFKHPPGPEQDFIKRVVGLPGETVSLVAGRLLVDGRPVDEPYVAPLYRSDQSFGPVRVGPGQFFLLGDHRNRSSDSREWGAVPAELIKGRAFLILFSTSASLESGRRPGEVTLRSLAKKLFNIVFRARTERFLRPIR